MTIQNTPRFGQAGLIKVMLVIVVLAVASAVLWLTIGQQEGQSLKKTAQLKAAELAGDVAAAVMENTSAGLHNVPIEVFEIADELYQAQGIGNTQLVHTSEGNVIFDTGLSIQAAKQLKLLREVAPGPTVAVIVSHSHADHIGGVKFWLEEGTEIISHREFSEEQRYLKELEPFQWVRNRNNFPWMPEEPSTNELTRYGGVVPTRTVGEEDYSFELGGKRFEVLSTPGAEGADNIVLWLPDQKILLSGDFFGPIFPQFPNIFTMRGEKVRKPIEYVRSLEKIIALGPEMVVPSHLKPVTGADEIMSGLVRMRDAVQYVHDQVIAGMNVGKTVHQLMAEIKLPQHLELTQQHGRVSWGVKSIWEYYATWFHFDTTTELYPVPASYIYAELAELAGNEALVAKAQQHLADAEPVHAIHFTEIALAGDENYKPAWEARRDALNMLLTQAENGLRNDYEMFWLKSRLRLVAEQLDGG